VIEVSHKAISAPAAGPDFTPTDVPTLASVRRRPGPEF
jgi:hypothetical protein